MDVTLTCGLVLRSSAVANRSSSLLDLRHRGFIVRSACSVSSTVVLPLLNPLSFNKQQQSMPRRVITSGRSCLECRRRKIKCDRSLPCAYCVRTHIHCTYPQPKTGQDADHSVDSNLVGRVESIECKFQSLERSLAQIKQLLHTNPPLSGQEQNQLRPVSLSFTIQSEQ